MSLLSSSLLCFIFLSKDPEWELFLPIFIIYFSTLLLQFRPGWSSLYIQLLHKMGNLVYLMFLFFLVQGFVLIVGSQRGIIWESKEGT